jgi:hypothetical protein
MPRTLEFVKKGTSLRQADVAPQLVGVGAARSEKWLGVNCEVDAVGVETTGPPAAPAGTDWSQTYPLSRLGILAPSTSAAR